MPLDGCLRTGGGERGVRVGDDGGVGEVERDGGHAREPRERTPSPPATRRLATGPCEGAAPPVIPDPAECDELVVISG
ncbi:hypothetical protein GCM10010531_33380 [Blastococcus jejuensis]|uniref:Uncharacterized protein n=1 Tax=Blastococcus jejuensis TaxID=351224 RepID=A0ABP6PFV2_9ACTN